MSAPTPEPHGVPKHTLDITFDGRSNVSAGAKQDGNQTDATTDAVQHGNQPGASADVVQYNNQLGASASATENNISHSVAYAHQGMLHTVGNDLITGPAPFVRHNSVGTDPSIPVHWYGPAGFNSLPITVIRSPPAAHYAYQHRPWQAAAVSSPALNLSSMPLLSNVQMLESFSEAIDPQQYAQNPNQACTEMEQLPTSLMDNHDSVEGHITAEDSPFQCPFSIDCQPFGIQGNLDRHIREVHLRLRPYRCPVETCFFADQGFARAGTRDNHVRNAHAG